MTTTADATGAPSVAPQAHEPPAPAASEARFGPPWLFVAIGALVLVGLAMRVVFLDARAVHHDESLHALFSYHLANGQGYRHDPLTHGPFQFHIIALFFKLFGDGDGMARLPAAIAGAALIATPLLLRRPLGAAGTIAASVFLAASPVLLYYSRFARNDPFVALWTMLGVVAIWRYREDGRFRWLILLTAMTALQFSTKETAYLIVAVQLLYLNAALTMVLVDRLELRGRQRVLGVPSLFLIAWVLAVVWPWAGERYRLGERPREADLLVVLGTIVLPFLAAAVQIPLHLFSYELDGGDRERVVGGLTVSVLTVAAAEVGLWWNWRRWLILAGIVYAIVVPLFTTMGTNLPGFAGAYWTQLDYWLAQQDVQRGTQPWFYYSFMAPLYESASLLPAAIGGLWLVIRGDRFARLLGWWFLGTFLVLSYAGEKMPWLNVHLALPLAILGGYAVGRAFDAIRANPRGFSPLAWPPMAIGAALVALLLVVNVRAGTALAYDHPDTPIEPLIYTQTSPDIPRLVERLDALAEVRGGRAEVPVLVDSSESMAWPWAWYLRKYPQASYVDGEGLPAALTPGAVVFAGRHTVLGSPELAAREGQHVAYVHRWWFAEEGYRATTRASLAEGLSDGTLVSDWLQFLWERGDREGIGSLDGEAIFPPDTPPLEGASVAPSGIRGGS